MSYQTNYELSPESAERVRDFHNRHENIYTIQEAAAILRKSIVTLRRYMKTGELKYTKVHGRVYFTERQVVEFMKGGEGDE